MEHEEKIRGYIVGRGRLGFYHRLHRGIPEHVRAELRDVELEETMLRSLELLKRRIRVLTSDIKETVKLLSIRAEQKLGIRLRTRMIIHKRRFCVLCLGERSLHFPYIWELPKGGCKLNM